MNLLLDTHTFLWLVGAPELLSPTASAAIQDQSNTLYLSYASIWEMQIKVQLQKLALPNTFERIVEEQQRVNNIQLLPITPDHIYKLDSLPSHHKDPFDRLIASLPES
ncbi:MAG: type II toxin-antitoxin system VapC family toxin [Roseiflexaceae bacterium]|nr:type II toxin-antitoxin system VapC family toxin [Roseiflexaceae bacterium]